MTTKLAGQQSTTTTHRKFSRPWYSDNHVAMTKRTPNTTDTPKRTTKFSNRQLKIERFPCMFDRSTGTYNKNKERHCAI